MPAKYALLTTKRQAAADESNKQEQLHFSPIQKTFITFKEALYNYNYMGKVQPMHQSVSHVSLGKLMHYLHLNFS